MHTHCIDQPKQAYTCACTHSHTVDRHRLHIIHRYTNVIQGKVRYWFVLKHGKVEKDVLFMLFFCVLCFIRFWSFFFSLLLLNKPRLLSLLNLLIDNQTCFSFLRMQVVGVFLVFVFLNKISNITSAVQFKGMFSQFCRLCQY